MDGGNGKLRPSQTEESVAPAKNKREAPSNRGQKNQKLLGETSRVSPKFASEPATECALAPIAAVAELACGL